MFNIGSDEILIFIIVAIIFIKPEDLPTVFYRLGEFFKYMKDLFSTAKAEIDKAFTELKEIQEENFDYKKEIDTLASHFSEDKVHSLIEKKKRQDELKLSREEKTFRTEPKKVVKKTITKTPKKNEKIIEKGVKNDK